jgi:hypothetical protein
MSRIPTDDLAFEGDDADSEMKAGRRMSPTTR